MRLNNRGYMLVEIVVATVLAMSIGYYLLEITYDFKDVNEDLYQKIIYTTKKNVITKNILNDLEEVAITSIVEETGDGESYIDFYVSDTNSGDSRYKRLQLVTLDDGVKKIEYGNYDTVSGSFLDDYSYYVNEFVDSMVVGEVKIDSYSDEDGISDFYSILIPVSSLYDDEVYDIKLLVPVCVPK